MSPFDKVFSNHVMLNNTLHEVKIWVLEGGPMGFFESIEVISLPDFQNCFSSSKTVSDVSFFFTLFA